MDVQSHEALQFVEQGLRDAGYYIFHLPKEMNYSRLVHIAYHLCLPLVIPYIKLKAYSGLIIVSRIVLKLQREAMALTGVKPPGISVTFPGRVNTTIRSIAPG